MTHAELEAAYLALCDRIVSDTRRIVAFAGNDNSTQAGRAAVVLMDAACDAKEAYLMQQEQSGSYDLAALRVNATVPSNSETGWEREE